MHEQVSRLVNSYVVLEKGKQRYTFVIQTSDMAEANRLSKIEGKRAVEVFNQGVNFAPLELAKQYIQQHPDYFDMTEYVRHAEGKLISADIAGWVYILFHNNFLVKTTDVLSDIGHEACLIVQSPNFQQLISLNSWPENARMVYEQGLKADAALWAIEDWIQKNSP